MNKNPLVSIIIPSYNHKLYIRDCIESIVNQSFKNYELIIIDDGSSDGSEMLLLELQKKYQFYLELNENQGLSKTLNRGIRDLSKGKYITFCASDDMWVQGKLEKQVHFLEQNLDFAMVYGRAFYIDEYGKSDDVSNRLQRRYKGGEIFTDLIFQNFHPPVNYMIRYDILKELNFYREHIWAEDFDMNLRIAEKYKIGFIDDYLSYYRINYSARSKALNFKTMNSHRDSIEQFKSRPEYNEAIKLWYYRNFRWYAPFKNGKLIALKGMFKNLDKILTIEFWESFLVLIFKWH